MAAAGFAKEGFLGVANTIYDFGFGDDFLGTLGGCTALNMSRGGLLSNWITVQAIDVMGYPCGLPVRIHGDFVEAEMSLLLESFGDAAI